MWYIIIIVHEGNLTGRKNALQTQAKKTLKKFEKVLDKLERL